MSKKRKKKFIDEFNNELPKYKNLLPININEKSKIYNTDSWFSIESKSANNGSNNIIYKNKFQKEVINCQKIEMVLTVYQKKILNNWFDAHTKMYNETLKYIRNSCNYFKNNIIRSQLKDLSLNKYSNFIYLRSKLLEIKKDIQKNSMYDNKKINIHTLDYAIRQLVSNIKSAVSNLKNSHIKRFRIKFWKINRPSKTIDIEKENINGNRLCYKTFGDIKYIYNKKDYQLSEIKSNVKINYNSILNKYTLLIPTKHKTEKLEDKPRNIISLDPGLRTFMTGLSEKEQFNIAPNINKKLRDKIKKLDNIKFNSNISKKIKKKNETLINKKIHNMVDDLHWKVIKFLIRNVYN